MPHHEDDPGNDFYTKETLVDSKDPVDEHCGKPAEVAVESDEESTTKHSEGEETIKEESKVGTCKGISNAEPHFAARGIVPKNKGA